MFAAIEKYLQQRKSSQALASLRALLKDTGILQNKADAENLLSLVAKCFQQKQQPDLKKAATHAMHTLHDPEALYQLGFQLNAAGYPDIAAAILAYGHRQFRKDLQILYELVAALEMQGRYVAALTYLRAANPSEFLAQYLLAFNTLMAGDIAEAKVIASRLDASSGSSHNMVTRLNRVFAREEAVRGVTSLDENDHRGWHFILTGGLLLHLPPPQAQQPGGYYAYLEDSESLCKEGIQRLAAVLEAWKWSVPKVWRFDNPESNRLGLAMADILGVRSETAVLPEKKGLFVFYDHSSVISEVLEHIAKHHKEMQVYCHASQINREYTVAPDFTNLLYESIVTPWNKHIIFPWRPDLPTEAPTESDPQLAKRIVKSTVASDALDDMQQLLDLAVAGKQWAAAMQAENSPREKQWRGRLPS
jgi:hypothetical protein